MKMYAATCFAVAATPVDRGLPAGADGAGVAPDCREVPGRTAVALAPSLEAAAAEEAVLREAAAAAAADRV